MNLLWWGYLHQNGAVIAKRYFGNAKNFPDVPANDFVVRVVPPFEADSREKAFEIIRQKCKGL